MNEENTPGRAIPVLTPVQRRALRASAHHLNPVVSIAQKGLQPSVLTEIDRCLHAHELIKVRLYGVERDERAALETEICAALGCAPVQQIGNLLVLWRPADHGAEAENSALAGRDKKPRANAKHVPKKIAAAATANPRRRVAAARGR